MTDRITHAKGDKESSSDTWTSASRVGPEVETQLRGAPTWGRLPATLQRASSEIGRVSLDEMRVLQRTIGNQAVNRLMRQSKQLERSEQKHRSAPSSLGADRVGTVQRTLV